MSLSVERLKELENIEKDLSGFWADSSPLQIAALDCIKAIRELIAIKEAEPVATVCFPDPDDEREGVMFSREDWKRLDKLVPTSQLIVKPE